MSKSEIYSGNNPNNPNSPDDPDDPDIYIYSYDNPDNPLIYRSYDPNFVSHSLDEARLEVHTYMYIHISGLSGLLGLSGLSGLLGLFVIEMKLI